MRKPADRNILSPGVSPSGGGITRRGVLAGAASLPLAGLLPGTSLAAFSIPETPPLERMDYAKARRHFHSNILQKGPAPGEFEPLGTPPEAQRVTYCSGADGSLELVAWITPYEPSRTLKPAVLFLHGGNATGDGHWALMKPYADAGFVAMLPTMRGENGQPGVFSGFYDEVDDALAAAAYLENLPGIDRNRIFLAGHSIGGTMALLTALARPFRAAVPMSANPDAWSFFNHFKEDIRFDTSNEREFIMRSAVCFAGGFNCPVLLLRGSEERRFSERHRLMVERARDAGTSISEKTLPGNHNGYVPAAVAESIEFFNANSI